MNILPLWFVYVAAGMRVGGGFLSARAAYKGKTEPNPISWLLWTIAPLITFFAALSAEGFYPGLIVTLAIATSPLLVFAATLMRNRRALKFDRLNTVCFIIAITGLALWLLTSDPLLAIVLALSADFVSAIPTIVKIERKPYSEYLRGYVISMSAMTIAILATQRVDFFILAYPIYSLTMNSVLIIFSLLARAGRTRPKSRSKPRKRSRK